MTEIISDLMIPFNNIKDLLECPICTDIFDDPITTTCGHTFCKKCIKGLAGSRVRCPNCNSRISKSHCESKNIVIDKLLFKIYPERELLENNIKTALELCNSDKYRISVETKYDEWEYIIKDGSKVLNITDINPIVRDCIFYTQNEFNRHIRYFKYDNNTYLYCFITLPIRLKLIKNNPLIFNTPDAILTITHESITPSEKYTLHNIVRKHLRNDPNLLVGLKEYYDNIPEQEDAEGDAESDSESDSEGNAEGNAEGVAEGDVEGVVENEDDSESDSETSTSESE